MYGVTPGQGYGIKGASSGLNIALFEAPLKGFYTPIRGDAVQSGGGVDFRMIHPAASGDDLLLSRLGRGPPDELGRPTFQNHIAIIPRELLEAGRVSFATVDAALAAWEKANAGVVGELSPLDVLGPAGGSRLGSGLRDHVTRAAVETLATRRMDDPEARTLLLCRDTPPAIRNEILFHLVELLNLVADVAPFTAMSDAPTASSMNTFNLVVAPRGVRGDGTWGIVESSAETAPLRRTAKREGVYNAIAQAFAADAAQYG
jgi:hypothetical protein